MLLLPNYNEIREGMNVLHLMQLDIVQMIVTSNHSKVVKRRMTRENPKLFHVSLGKSAEMQLHAITIMQKMMEEMERMKMKMMR